MSAAQELFQLFFNSRGRLDCFVRRQNQSSRRIGDAQADGESICGRVFGVEFCAWAWLREEVVWTGRRVTSRGVVFSLRLGGNWDCVDGAEGRSGTCPTNGRAPITVFDDAGRAVGGVAVHEGAGAVAGWAVEDV